MFDLGSIIPPLFILRLLEKLLFSHNFSCDQTCNDLCFELSCYLSLTWDQPPPTPTCSFFVCWTKSRVCLSFRCDQFHNNLCCEFGHTFVLLESDLGSTTLPLPILCPLEKLRYFQTSQHFKIKMLKPVFLVPAQAGKSYRRGRLSTLDLPALTSLDWLLLYWKCYLQFFYKTSYLNGEVKCTEPSPLVRIPWRR